MEIYFGGAIGRYSREGFSRLVNSEVRSLVGEEGLDNKIYNEGLNVIGGDMIYDVYEFPFGGFTIGYDLSMATGICRVTIYTLLDTEISEKVAKFIGMENSDD